MTVGRARGGSTPTARRRLFHRPPLPVDLRRFRRHRTLYLPLDVLQVAAHGIARAASDDRPQEQPAEAGHPVVAGARDGDQRGTVAPVGAGAVEQEAQLQRRVEVVARVELLGGDGIGGRRSIPDPAADGSSRGSGGWSASCRSRPPSSRRTRRRRPATPADSCPGRRAARGPAPAGDRGSRAATGSDPPPPAAACRRHTPPGPRCRAPGRPAAGRGPSSGRPRRPAGRHPRTTSPPRRENGSWRAPRA